MLGTRFALVLILITWVVSLGAVAGKLTKDLPPDAPLRIGVKYKPTTCDKKTKAGDRVSMNYVGTLIDGREFDSTKGREPFDFVLGAGYVIKGWDQGLLDMCEGEKRKLTIPSGLGYGNQGSGIISPGATLFFEVELVKILLSTDEL